MSLAVYLELPARGLTVFVVDTGQPAGEPVVLLHGMLTTGENGFRGEIAALSDRYRVIVPDARGHGRTLGPPEPFSFHVLALDTIALVEALGVRRAHFVGFSLGAMELLVLARLRPDLVRSLVLMGGGPCFDEATRHQIARISASPPSSLLQRLTEWHEPAQGKGAAQRLLAQWRQLSLSGELALTPAELQEIAAPTLLLFGDRDPFYAADLPIRMRAALPHAELCIVPNSGHAVNLANPALVQLAIRQFLARHPLSAEELPAGRGAGRAEDAPSGDEDPIGMG
ncbi:MAG: alpha/beta hydrolase [Chloroflexota bacterium]|nr:alpha/beta hydrolase [Dehalococcoidia bacterium]MDW8254384.1 alpha/beta hydrolase [Chloroflexota bacterium]